MKPKEALLAKLRPLSVPAMVLVVSLIVLVVIIQSFSPPSRDDYGEIDLNDARWLRGFQRDYEAGLVSGSEWVNDPQTVALRIAGYPNPDNIAPESINVLTISPDSVVVTVLSRNLMDDSIKKEETRVEFIRSEEVWTIEWVGYRQQCYRGLIFGWTTRPCP